MCIRLFKPRNEDNKPMIEKRFKPTRNKPEQEPEQEPEIPKPIKPNAKTNVGLIEYCKAQLGRPYWYGSFGQLSTPYLLKYNKGRFPQYYQAKDFESQMGVKVHDCIGLIKGYMWSKDPEDTKPVYAQGFPDVSADMQFNRSKRKGTSMSTLPEVPGVLVFMKGHVGVYLGNGEVIEARGHKFGVVITKLKERPWTKWAYIDEIEYI